jgi:hypothetical protein
VIRRLVETFAFFKTFAVDILKFLLISALPIVLIETSLSVYIIESQAQGFVKYVPSLLHLLYKPIYTGGFIYLMSLLVSQGNGDIRKCLSVGLNNWQNLIIVYFASSVIIIAGIVAFIIPGLILFARLSLSEFIVVLEKATAKKAITKSYGISKSFTLEIIGSTFLLSLILAAISLFVQLGANAISLNRYLLFVIIAMLGIILESVVSILLFRFYDLSIKAQRGLGSSPGEVGTNPDE